MTKPATHERKKRLRISSILKSGYCIHCDNISKPLPAGKGFYFFVKEQQHKRQKTPFFCHIPQNIIFFSCWCYITLALNGGVYYGALYRFLQ